MAQSGYTPISLYYTTTAAAAPTAGNLVNGELAINITDGKLYYKDNAGVVQIIAGKGGTGVAGGSNTQVQFNSSGSLAGSANLTFNGTTLTAGGLSTTGATSTGTFSATGVATFSAGTVSLPAITTTGDANTGIFFPAADTIAFTEGGAESMRVDSTGRLLIGLTSSNAAFSGKLQVEGTSDAYSSLVRYSSSAGGAPAFYLARSKSATLGTNTIVASGDTLGSLIFAGANGTGYSDAAYIQCAVDGTPGASADMPGRLVFATSADGSATPTERMRITSTGSVGIGTTTPSAMLQVTGNSSTSALKVPNIEEVATISATAATGTIAYDITTQSVLYYTSNASANWTVNFRGSSGTSLNTLMATGESISCTFLVTQGATAYYNSAVQIDGTTSGVTTEWQGGTAPTTGNASSVDSYTYVIIKTGSATYLVLATQTRFA